MNTFKRGIHPPGNKELAADKAIVDFPLCEIYKVPAQQHLGAPAKPIVAPGDKVKKGQAITEPTGFVSAASHAPTSGTVREIGTVLHPATGQQTPAIFIEADGLDEWLEGLPLKRDPNQMSGSELLDCVKLGGIVGMGGATFPTHVKLSPPKDKVVEAFIVNGAECEPYLTADYRLMLEDYERIFGGVGIVMKILNLKEGIIAVEANKPDAIKLLRSKAPANIKVEYVKVKYPQGAEKQLINAVTGREVPSGGLPMDVGAVVQNLGTVAAIWDACAAGIPLIERITTITGRGIAAPKNLRVRVGTPLDKVLDFCGGLTGDAAKVVAGGPMMGFALGSLDTVIMKGTSGITVLRKNEVNRVQISACISCGRCVEACPMGLVPSTLSKLGEMNLFEQAMPENLMDCFECGCCTYVCPSNRPIVQYVKHLKALGREAAAKKKGA